MSLAVYWAFARVRFVDLLANRSRYLVGTLTYLIYISVFRSIYQAVYAGGGQLADFSLAEALSYVSVVWLLRAFYTNRLDEEITEELRQGSIVISLLRPVNVLGAKLIAAIGEAAFRLLLFTLPTALLVALIYGIRLPLSLSTAVWFLGSSVLAVLVYSLLNMQVGLLAVFTEHTLGLQRAKRVLIELFGGVLLPLAVFPDAVQSVLGLLPFQAVAYLPLQVYLGRANVLGVLGLQGLWVLLLVLINALLWQRAKHHLTVQGG